MSALLDSAATLDPQRKADLAANDERMAHVPGQWSPAWAKAEDRYWRAMARNAGECWRCGYRTGSHEDGCSEAPDETEEEA